MCTIDWHFAIPISWAIVSAALALLLYKSSGAVFEQSIVTSENNNKRIRLVGSIAIAGAIFFGLKWATPPMLITGQQSDAVSVSKKALSATTSKLDEAIAALDRLDACTAVTSIRGCKLETEEVRRGIMTVKEVVPQAAQ
jgi:hypothetical protein